MQRFSIFHVLLCFGLVAGQEPCTVGSKRSAKTSKYSDVLRSFVFLAAHAYSQHFLLEYPGIQIKGCQVDLDTKTGLQAKEVRLHQKRNGGWSQGKAGSNNFDRTHCIVLLRKYCTKLIYTVTKQRELTVKHWNCKASQSLALQFMAVSPLPVERTAGVDEASRMVQETGQV